MQTEAFRRARRFLNYLPEAKWLALVSSVVSGLLYVVLLIILALFVELMVNRGTIPSFDRLPLGEKNDFLRERIKLPDDPADTSLQTYWKDRARDLGMDEAKDSKLFKLIQTQEPTKLDEKDQRIRQSLLWYVNLPDLIHGTVGSEAGDAVLEGIKHNFQFWGPQLAIFYDLDNLGDGLAQAGRPTGCGALALIARKQASGQRWLVNPLVRLNDWMWRTGNTGYLRGLFIAALAMALLCAVALFTADYMAVRAVVEAITQLRRRVYHHTFRLGTLAFRALGPTEAVSVSTRHLEAVHDGMLAWLTVYFREPVKFGLLLLFAALISPYLAVAFLLFAVLVWLIGGQIAAIFRREGQLATFRAANQLALIQESLMLMRLVKVYLMEHFNQTRVERQFSSLARAQLRRYRGEAVYRPLLLFLGLLASMVLLLVAGFVVLHGHLSPTSMMILVTALVSLYWPSVLWLECRRLLRRCAESAQIVFDFLERTGTAGQIIEAEFLPPLSRQLEFDNVSFSEPGSGRKLLENISFVIPAGSRVAVVGPDEMEKHALLYLLPGSPTSGEIRIDRKNLRKVTLDSLRTQIAMVLQHNLVFNDTVANNIGCGDPGYPLPRIIEAAKIAHVHQFIQKLPRGYETMIGDLGHSLNAGEKFRIALARAILRDPALFVIEEPSMPLSEDTKGLLDDTYNRALQGRTVIFLPHRLSTIRSCDRVFLVFQGRLEASGEHRELLNSSEIYRHLQYQEFNEIAAMLQTTAPVIDVDESLV